MDVLSFNEKEKIADEAGGLIKKAELSYFQQQELKKENRKKLKKMQQEQLNKPKKKVEEQIIEENEEMDIMSMLKKKKLYLIESDFQKGQGGLLLNQFVKVMLEHLEYDKQDPDKVLEITLGLIDLFKEIDVNGDETMEWEEFSNHIIELGMLRKDRTFQNIIKKYEPSENIRDREKHESEIEQVYFYKQIKNLIVTEVESSKFKVYNSNTCDLLCEVNAHKGSVLATELLPKHNLLATSSNDLTINFWDTATFNLKQIVSTPEIQLTLRYANWKSNSLLYTGGSDAIIHYYDTSTLKEKGTLSGWNPFFKKDFDQYGHAGPIGDILPIKSQQTLVTCALDGKICLWDVPLHVFKKELQGHDKGVYSLAWSDFSPMNQCLISAGLDHEAFVWNTYVKERIFLLRGHNHPLIGVKCMPCTPQVITADISGMIKVWDVRNFMCMQTFNVPNEELNSFTLSTPKKCIITGARTIQYFEYDEPKDQMLTDEKVCIKVLYSEVMFSFITLHPDSIKVWDARNGKLICVHRKLAKQHELTQMILDIRERKLFVGDSTGKIFTVNIKNGAKMKKFEPHNSMIVDLKYWTSAQSAIKEKDQSKIIRRLISISREDFINIHDEDSLESSKSVRYSMRQHKGSVNCLSLQENSEILASCDNSGGVFLTNLSSYRQEQLLKGHKHEIKKILFMDPHDCLVIADAVGNIMFFSLAQTKIKNRLLFTKIYKTNSVTNVIEQFPITAINYFDKSGYLLLGDEFGNVTVWDCKLFIKILEKLRESKKTRRYSDMGSGIYQYDKIPNESEEEDFGEQKAQIEINLEVHYDTQQSESKKEKNIQDMAFITQQQQQQSQILSTLNKKIQSQDVILDSDLRQIFTDKCVKQTLQLKQAHKDYITHIEIIGNYGLMALTSFDCCVSIWRIDNWRKLGKLILGGDKEWAVKVDEEMRKQQSLKDAKEMIEKLKKVNYQHLFTEGIRSDGEGDEDEEPVLGGKLKDKQQQKGTFLKKMSKQEKLFGVLHKMEFQQDKQKIKDSKDSSDEEDQETEMVKQKKEISSDEEQDKKKQLEKQLEEQAEAKGQVLKSNVKKKLVEQIQRKEEIHLQAKSLINRTAQMIKNGWVTSLNENLIGQKLNDGVPKDLFQEENEEETDYHILNDLNDYKNNDNPQQTYVSKTIFKSKLSKNKLKI